MTQNDFRERAERRVRELKDFYSHLTTYVLVCTLLVIIDVASSGSGSDTFLGLTWAYWPIFGWGIAILFHAVSTFFKPTGWEERKVLQYMEQEAKRDEERRLNSS
jgi:amino acid transporter